MSNITDRELDRDIRNLFIPSDDQHIPLVSWDELEKIYGKKFVDKQKREIEKEKKRRQSAEKQ
ncbi:hypothetical protein M3O96_21405 [Aquiflexum sp. TKW24L]|uniref:hypothetical protein n=1 Tax=Aquiflexum sp. TKW24L TaxID=2942212 RepID=UPI0020BE92C7|nr:hypothetical protein [Aquiflexum sp. TKW24L]MCL6261667.1 hypothetical protein [Aquiflexum sp. TKW24L]